MVILEQLFTGTANELSYNLDRKKRKQIVTYLNELIFLMFSF